MSKNKENYFVWQSYCKALAGKNKDFEMFNDMAVYVS